jgi:transketolase
VASASWNLDTRELPGLVAGDELARLAHDDPRIVVLTADMKHSTRVATFELAVPARFVDLGCAEHNTVGVAAGLAASGKLPFVATFAAYSALLCAEQLRTDVGATGVPVCVLGHHAGVALSLYGMSHYAIEDIAVLRAIGTIGVASATDANMLRAILRAAVAHPAPLYVRVGGGRDPEVYADVPEFTLGRSWTLRDGSDLTIVATGAMVHRSLAAGDILRRRGVSARVVDMVSLSPLDGGAIRAAAADTGRILTVEEHRAAGGLGGAVAEYLVDHALPTPMRMVAIRLSHVPTGGRDDLLEHLGLSPDAIAAEAESLMARDRG